MHSLNFVVYLNCPVSQLSLKKKDHIEAHIAKHKQLLHSTDDIYEHFSSYSIPWPKPVPSALPNPDSYAAFLLQCLLHNSLIRLSGPDKLSSLQKVLSLLVGNVIGPHRVIHFRVLTHTHRQTHREKVNHHSHSEFLHLITCFGKLFLSEHL